MRASTAAPKLYHDYIKAYWAWSVSGAYASIMRIETPVRKSWLVSVDEGGLLEHWDILDDDTEFRSVGSSNGDKSSASFWNLCPWICSEYEPIRADGRLL